MQLFRELDAVVVRRLNTPEREVNGASSASRQPLVGDEGAIVCVLAADRYVVECVDDGGATVWLADFDLDELTRPPSDWRFTAEEVSAGVYRARGVGPTGSNVEATDTDPSVALATCRRFALKQATHAPGADSERG